MLCLLFHLTVEEGEGFQFSRCIARANGTPRRSPVVLVPNTWKVPRDGREYHCGRFFPAKLKLKLKLDSKNDLEKLKCKNDMNLSCRCTVQIEKISEFIFGSCTRSVDLVTEYKYRTGTELFVGQKCLQFSSRFWQPTPVTCINQKHYRIYGWEIIFPNTTCCKMKFCFNFKYQNWIFNFFIIYKVCIFAYLECGHQDQKW